MKSVGTYVHKNRVFVRKVGSDLLAIIPLAIAVLTLYLAGQPYKRGFNCDDESIRYPYKDNTISSTFLYIYSTFIPAITIIIVEFLLFKQRKTPIENEGSIERLTRDRPSYKGLLWQIYCQLSPFVFGALISQMTTDIAKYSIGRLRPHFIDLCHPEFIDEISGVRVILDLSTRSSARCRDYQFQYITDYTCSNTLFTDHRKRDGHLSFMSGHSSFSAFCLIYLVIYLQYRVKWKIGFCRPLYQSLLIYLTLYTGFSRISDYKHHWSDVLIGLGQGTAVAILTTHYISDLKFKKSSDETILNVNDVEKSKRNPNYNSCSVEVEESINNSS